MPRALNIIVPGGFEANFTLGFVKGLEANGVELLVVSCDETAARLTGAGIPNKNLRGALSVDRAPLAKLCNLLSYYFQLILLLLRHRGATVHFTGIVRNKFIVLEYLILNLVFRGLAGHYLYTVHNVLPHGHEQSRFYRGIYRRIYRAPQTLLVHTRQARAQLIDEFGVPATKIRLTTIGLNEEIRVTGLTSSEARHKLGSGDAEQLILFFGKIDWYKGLDLLLDAFDLLPSSKARLIIAGEFRHPAIREQIVRQWHGMRRSADVQLYDRFIPNEEAETFFKGCDLLCLPYRHIYQSGLVFLGPRFGLPMVATDVGALREFIGEDLGVVALSNDAAGIAESLHRLLAAPERFPRAHILRRAHELRWINVCRDLVSLYAASCQVTPSHESTAGGAATNAGL